MGQSTELTAKHWGITRAEQDQLAFESHQKAAKAWAEGFYADIVTPWNGARADNNVRADTSVEKLGTLKPVFDRGPAGTMTAGNSTPLTDGAAAVLLASEDWAAARGLPVLAYLRYGKVAAVDFVDHDRNGLLLAPAFAVSAMLAEAGLGFADFDLFEIHEAFAAQILATMKAWESPEFCRERLGRPEPLGAIDRGKLNPKGGSIAIGHPFGATGARVLGGAAKQLAARGHGRALLSVCTGGGMGVTAILER
jgi:acetyl-CoA C-acetyltransferase